MKSKNTLKIVIYIEIIYNSNYIKIYFKCIQISGVFKFGGWGELRWQKQMTKCTHLFRKHQPICYVVVVLEHGM